MLVLHDAFDIIVALRILLVSLFLLVEQLLLLLVVSLLHLDLLLLLLILPREQLDELLLGLVLLLEVHILLVGHLLLLLVVLRSSLAHILLVLVDWLLLVVLVLTPHDLEAKAVVDLDPLQWLGAILLSLHLAQNLESVGEVPLVMHDRVSVPGSHQVLVSAEA